MNEDDRAPPTAPMTSGSLPPLPKEPEAVAISVRPGKWWLPTVVTAGVVVLAYELREVLTPFVIAFLLAYALAPAVNLLAKAKIPRPLGALLVFAALTAGAITVAVYAVDYFRDEMVLAGKQVPARVENLLKSVEVWLRRETNIKLPHNARELWMRYGAQLRDHSSDILGYAREALFGTLSAVFVVLSLLIVPVFAFYLLIDFEHIVSRGGKLVPRRWQKPVFETFTEVDRMVGGYVRGQIIACAVLGTLYASGLYFIGLRLAIPIGLLTGMLAVVPYLGFATGLSLALVMGILDWHGFSFLAQVLAVMLGVQILDGFLVTPRVVGRSVGLGPVEVLLAMTVAGSVFGFIGVLLAVPLGAATKIVVRRAVRAYKASEFYRRAG